MALGCRGPCQGEGSTWPEGLSSSGPSRVRGALRTPASVGLPSGLLCPAPQAPAPSTRPLPSPPLWAWGWWPPARLGYGPWAALLWAWSPKRRAAREVLAGGAVTRVGCGHSHVSGLVLQPGPGRSLQPATPTTFERPMRSLQAKVGWTRQLWPLGAPGNRHRGQGGAGVGGRLWVQTGLWSRTEAVSRWYIWGLGLPRALGQRPVEGGPGRSRGDRSRPDRPLCLCRPRQSSSRWRRPRRS